MPLLARFMAGKIRALSLNYQQTIIKMKKIYLLSIIVAIALTAGAIVVNANPSYFALTKQTSTATTSPVFMTAGAATSTLVFDAYAAYSNTSADSLYLAIQFTGSSTASVLGWQYEYSTGFPGNDCATYPESCDWFSLGVGNSTTATSTYVTSKAENLLVTASSTIGGRTIPQDKVLKLVNVPTPLRYVRAVFYLPVGSSPGSVWAQFIPIKERTE